MVAQKAKEGLKVPKSTMYPVADQRVRVSDRAQAKIRSLVDTEGASEKCVRVFAEERPEGGVELGLSFDHTRDRDCRLELEGITLIVDRASFETVRDVEIDYEESAERSGFTFRWGSGCETPAFAK